MSKQSTDRIPLVIGVTGHRHLRSGDLPGLRSVVKVQLQSIIAAHQNTKLIVLSPLAGGADQLVADVALKLKAEENAEIDVYVPLPMPREHFRNTIDEGDRAEFDRLYELATRKFVVERNLNADWTDPEVRRRAFLRGGIYLAIHSQILFALWDGELDPGGVGTDAIVDFRLRGALSSSGADEFRTGPLDSNEAGPLYHIWTPRRDGNPAQLLLPPCTCQIKYSEEFGAKYEFANATKNNAPKASPQEQKAAENKAETFFLQVFGKIDEYNENVKKLENEPSKTSEKGETEEKNARRSPDEVFKGLLDSKQRDLVGAAALDHVDKIASWYQTASRLAGDYQSLTNNTFTALMGLATVATLCAQFRSKFPFLAWGYVAALILGMIVFYRMILKRKVHAKRLDCRALAEALRVFFYWRLVGVLDNVAKYYLSSQRSELNWIRYAMRTLQMSTRLDAEGEVAPTTADRIKAVREAWIKGQSDWMGRKHFAFWWKRKALNTVAFIFYAIAIVQGVVLCFQPEETYVTMWMGLSVFAFGLLHLYAEIMGYSHRITEYDRLKTLYDKGDRSLPNTDTPTADNLVAAQKILRDLGKEALIENADWLVYHRNRVVKPVP